MQMRHVPVMAPVGKHTMMCARIERLQFEALLCVSERNNDLTATEWPPQLLTWVGTVREAPLSACTGQALHAAASYPRGDLTFAMSPVPLLL